MTLSCLFFLTVKNTSPRADSPGMLLHHPSFPRLWGVWLMANICMWMSDVAAAWLMTSLTDSKLMVAMIQTCTTLPVFLLALPGGAIADIVDRRSGFLAAQCWTTLAAAILAAAAWQGALSAPLLLVLTFAASMATALRWPVYSAIVPEVVTAEALPTAIVLNGMAVNASRVLGPLLAGAIIAWLGGAWVFALTAALSLTSAAMLWRWRYEPQTPPSSTGSLGAAMTQGIAFARQSRPLQAVLAWSVGYFMSATALVALLPLIARAHDADGAGGARIYAVLFACLGCGAIGVGFMLHVFRRRWSEHGVIVAGSVLLALCIACMALSRHAWLSAAVMLVAGAAWLAVGNTLSIAAQFALPPQLRARGMSLFLMAVMAGGAGGAALFGAAADWLGLRPALFALSATGIALCVLLGRRYRI